MNFPKKNIIQKKSYLALDTRISNFHYYNLSFNKIVDNLREKHFFFQVRNCRKWEEFEQFTYNTYYRNLEKNKKSPRCSRELHTTSSFEYFLNFLENNRRNRLNLSIFNERSGFSFIGRHQVFRCY